MKTKRGEKLLPSNTALQSETRNRSKQSNQERAAALWERPRILKGADNYNVVLACRQVVPQIIKKLVQLTQSTHGPTAVKACEIVLNRAYGRAPVTVDITHKLTADRALLEQAAQAILLRRAERAAEVAQVTQATEAIALLGGAAHSGGYSAVEGVGGVERVPPKKAPNETTIDNDNDGSVNIDRAVIENNTAPKRAKRAKAKK